MSETPVSIGIAQRHIVVAGLAPRHVVPMKLFVLNTLYKHKLEKQGSKFVRVPDKPYASANANATVWRFHKNSLEAVKEHLRSRGIAFTESHVPMPRAAKVRMIKNTEKVPYENQPIVIDYLTGEKPVSKLVELQTGKGKTFSTLYSILGKEMRTGIIVSKMYLSIWMDDIPKTIKINKSLRELMVVKSSKDLNNLIAYSGTKEYERNTKIICFTTGVMNAYCKAFKENYRSDEYDCPPWELFDRLGIGIKVVDEVHKNFHQNFMMDLWLDYQQSINLSATMDSSDDEQNRYYQLAFPKNERCPHIPYDKFIEVVDYRYYLGTNVKINTKQRGMGTYSHVQFEESVMRVSRYVMAYMNIICEVAKTEFFDIRDPEEKLLILCSTKKFAKMLQVYMQKRYPNEKVGTYLQEDSYDVLEKYSISISTVMSAGTGVDIPGLRTNIMTQALGSKQSNEQCLGRTRKFLTKPKEHRPRFVFLTCQDIAKHKEYAMRKHDYFSDKSFCINVYNSGYRI